MFEAQKEALSTVVEELLELAFDSRRRFAAMQETLVNHKREVRRRRSDINGWGCGRFYYRRTRVLKTMIIAMVAVVRDEERSTRVRKNDKPSLTRVN